MNVAGISNSIRLLKESIACPQCGSTSRVGRGLCLNCLLQTGLGYETGNNETLDGVLAEIEVRDADWRLGNYQILEEIGRGGMGVIYRARQRHSRRIVALKRVLSYHADSQETLARFRREAEAAASLDHPNILPIYEVSESEDGLPFFSMKFAPGGSLLDAGPALRYEPRRSVALMAKVARAVQYAHVQGILHRDLKPGNILLDARGEALVSDFGLAKWLDTTSDVTRTLTIFGTPGYIAPEQARGPAAQLKPAADVYSLGAILFDLFTGRPPFLGEHALAVIQQAAEKPAPKLRTLAPSLDRDLETICTRCLEREPQARYHSAGELAEDLERWLEGRPIIARPVSPATRVWRWSRRNPVLAGSIAACLVLGGAAIGWQVQSRRLEATVRQEQLTARSVAVLPFLDLDNVLSDADFGAWLPSALQNELSRSGPARVIGFESSRGVGVGAAEDVKEAGIHLKSRTVLGGTVRHVKGKLRVSIRLMDAAQGDLLLQNVFEFDSAKISASQIAHLMSLGLEPVLRSDDLSSVKPAQNDPALRNKSARELILAGRELQDRRTALDTDRAIQCFQKATTIEPASALAHGYLALASIGRMTYLADSTSLLIAEKAATEALRLNPNQSEAHRAMAMILEQKGEFAGAQEEVLRAVEFDGLQERLASRLADISIMLGRPDRALQWYQIASHWQVHPADYDHMVGDCFADLCDDNHAEEAYQRVAELHPEMPEGWMGLCRLQLLQGHPDAARKIWLENATRYQSFEFAREIGAQVEFLTRHYREAEKQYAELAQTDPDGGGRFYGAMSYKSALGRLHCLTGNPVEGRSLLELCLRRELEALKLAPRHPQILYRVAAVEASLTQVEPALKYLGDAVSAGWLDYRSLALDPRFDALRNDPRYNEIFGSIVTRVTSLRRSMPTE